VTQQCSVNDDFSDAHLYLANPHLSTSSSTMLAKSSRFTSDAEAFAIAPEVASAFRHWFGEHGLMRGAGGRDHQYSNVTGTPFRRAV
jgi:hypothetical protein